MHDFHSFFKMIEVPLLRSFQEGETGAEFAAKLIDLGDNGMFGKGIAGQQIYDMVTGYQQGVVDLAIKTYTPIWSVVSMTPAKWANFLTDFYNAPKLWEEQEREEDARIRSMPRSPAMQTQPEPPEDPAPSAPTPPAPPVVPVVIDATATPVPKRRKL